MRWLAGFLLFVLVAKNILAVLVIDQIAILQKTDPQLRYYITVLFSKLDDAKEKLDDELFEKLYSEFLELLNKRNKKFLLKLISLNNYFVLIPNLFLCIIVLLILIFF